MRLIDPEQLKKDIRCSFSSDADAILISQFINDYAVPVDAEPVRHGHWIPYMEADFGYADYGVECSRCHRRIDDEDHPRWELKRCPFCDAKMDEEETNVSV